MIFLLTLIYWREKDWLENCLFKLINTTLMFFLQIEWNSVPNHVVCAFPYILSITQESVEFRYAVNGSLLQTLCMPELKLITSKVNWFVSMFRFAYIFCSVTSIPTHKVCAFPYILSITGWVLLHCQRLTPPNTFHART